MATVPTGYVFWDVSANKSYAAGTTMPTLGNGDYIVPATTSNDGYYQQYIYYTSRTEGGITEANCWSGAVRAQYVNQAQKLPFNSLGGKPVRFFAYNGSQITSCPTKDNAGNTSSISAITNLKRIEFYNCTKLATAPVLPTGIKSLNYAFYNTAITAPPSNMASLANVVTARYCFGKCTQLASANDLSALTLLLDVGGIFHGCSSLVNPPALPPNVQVIDNAFEGCTSLVSAPDIPSTVQDMGYAFKGCASLVSAPDIPDSVGALYYAFKGCTSLTGFVHFNGGMISNAVGAFENTTNQIILLGPAAMLGALKTIAKTGNNGNVYAGIIATPVSFTAIRGTYDSTNQTFEENVAGTDCKLTINYTAPYVQDALIKLPTLTSEGDPVGVTWRIGTLSGAILTSAGTQALAVGTLVAVISLGSSETAASYSLRMNTEYTYDEEDYTWASGTVSAVLTFSNALIDVNPTGIGMAFFGEVPDDYAGLLVKKDAEFTGTVAAEDTITTNDVVKADNLYLELDENAASGDDYEIIQALTALGWTDCLIND